VSEQAETPAATPAADETARYAPLLASGERVLVVRRRHWFTFIQAARWFLGAVAVGILIEILNGQVGNRSASHVLTWGFLAFVLVGVAGVGWYTSSGSASGISSPPGG
jgi:hypothetical protein